MNAKTDTGSRVAGGPRGGECRAQQYAGGTHRLYGGGLDRGKSSGQLDIPFHNPESCALADGYIIYATLPGAQLLDSVALSAQSQAKAVVLTIDGCIFDRPKVIGVSTAP